MVDNQCEIDQEVEMEIRTILTSKFEPIYHERTSPYVDCLMALDPFKERFNYFKEIVGDKVFKAGARILISGFSAGSEMLVAKLYGFDEVHGVEVDPFLVEIAQSRFRKLSKSFPIYNDGNALPYADNFFDAVFSGHIIEHTRDPEFYLEESLRVLTKGGCLYLEFPTRFHSLELHTQLPSFEWLPTLIRNFLIRTVSGKYSPLDEDVKLRYSSIVTTELKQISMVGVKRMLAASTYPCSVLQSGLVAPGVVRCVVQKG